MQCDTHFCIYSVVLEIRYQTALVLSQAHVYFTFKTVCVILVQDVP